MNISIIAFCFLSISFWAYCGVFYRIRNQFLMDRNTSMFIFGATQILLTLINLIWIFGWIIGLMLFVVFFFSGNVTKVMYASFGLRPKSSYYIFVFCTLILMALTTIKIVI